MVKTGIPCSSGAGGVGSINVPSESFSRWQFEMKLSPCIFVWDSGLYTGNGCFIETWQFFSEFEYFPIFSNFFAKGIGYRVGLGYRV